MELISILRHFLGYVVGIGTFMVLIPWGIWLLASVDYPLFNIPFITSDAVRYVLSSVLLIVGLAFVVWSNAFLLIKGKGGPTDIGGISISPPTQKLVVNGPYRHTRNPMVFGVHTVYMAMAVYLNSLICLVGLILFLTLVVKKLLAVEEKRLLNDFGDAYEQYRAQTPMIFPVPWKKRDGS